MMNGIEQLIAASALIAGAAVAQPLENNEEVIPQVKSVECLALNMYHEARGQGTAGELAVTAVVLNRVNDSRFPNTICEVVQQGPTRPSWRDPKISFPIKHKCQFSWYCDGKSDNPYDKKTYNKMYELADAVLSNEIPFLDITDGATHYHADYVNPAWAKTKTKTVEIQDHIFYRWEK